MALHDLRGKAAFVGAATAGIRGAAGFQAIELLAGVVADAVADAGLRMAEVDGLFGCMQTDFLSMLSLGEQLGIQPKVTGNNRIGGSSFLAHTLQAALALEAGLCEVAVVCYASTQRSTAGRLMASAASEWSVWEAPYAARFPVSSYALAASRHMHAFGTTRADLAAVAVSARRWAQLNPEAFMREPLSLEDVLAARMVSSPLGKLDCCLVTDGAGALVMVRRERAGDLAKPPIFLLGGAVVQTHKQISEMPDLCTTGARESGRLAYEMAGVAPADMDLVQLYDAFTINTILLLEDLGFCPKGEGGRFVSEGRIAPGGSLPVNTNGGGLSCCHPGMYGLFTLIEGVRQLRGEAGDRQVVDAELCLCHGSGGVLSSMATNILGTAATL